MTHPIIEARRRRAHAMAKLVSPDPDLVARLEAVFLGHLAEHDAEVLWLIQEPGLRQALIMHAAEPLPPMRAPLDHYVIAWRAGIDALRKEIAP